MNHEYNDKSITYIDSWLGKLTISPLSVDILTYIEELGGQIVSDHLYPEDPTDGGRFRYIITFPNKDYGVNILKGAGCIGREKDLFEIHITYRDTLSKYNDITNGPLGYLTEEDLYSIIRLVKRLDENGHIKPLETSQNEQLS